MRKINIFICKGDIPFPGKYQNIIENSKQGHHLWNLSEPMEFDLYEYNIIDAIQSISEENFIDSLKLVVNNLFQIANKLSKNKSMDQSQGQKIKFLEQYVKYSIKWY